jgi:aminoglycoside 3-N-acetyltransferase
MAESRLIDGTPAPATVDTLVRDLRDLGVEQGDVLVVHTSLGSLGWVVGGAAAVVDALLNAVGPTGTVTMPAHSADWSDPAGWANPPVPRAWWSTIVDSRPAFDPYATPLRGMGAVADNLLLRRNTLRSSHPLYSHMACGAQAGLVVQSHPLDDGFGDGSPLGRLYELDAKVVLLGVGHGSNTSLHLAESRAVWPGKVAVQQRSTVMVDGVPTVVTWSAHEPDGDDFDRVGEVLDSAGLVGFGTVTQAHCRLARQRAIVDAAVPWFEANRG